MKKNKDLSVNIPLPKVIVFTQTNKKRVLVGTLWKEKRKFHFQYNIDYLRNPSSIPLGPDLPLTPKLLTHTFFFESLKDRIPSNKNPAYKDYCSQWGISENEENPLILITTIGNRGPSSFIFRFLPSKDFKSIDLKNFRNSLKLTLDDFALFVDSLSTTIYRTESNKIQSKLLLNLCELLSKSPEALEIQLTKRGMYLHDDKIQNIKNYISKITTRKS